MARVLATKITNNVLGEHKMGKIKINKLFGALIFAFCLLFISNYVGNTLIPPFKYYNLTKSTNYDWIKWPEIQNAKNASEEEKMSNLAKPKSTKMILENEEKDKSGVNLKNGERIKPGSEQSLHLRLATADLAKGKKVARKCVACHSFKKGGKNKIGPNLYEIMGRERGATPGYNYSKALKKTSEKWSFSDMDKFLLKPKKFLPGTRMSFKGIKSANDRAALIIYLRSFAETPLTLPK